MIFNIQRYSTHGDPGIRTVIFLKGCSLGYRWCQNPGNRARTQDLLYNVRSCLEGCELCAKVAPGVIERVLSGLFIHREKLTPEHLTTLTNCYPTQALAAYDEMKSVEEIMITTLRDKPFYNRSDGGLTLSGDEPFMQPEMAMVLLRVNHEASIHTTIETCLYVPQKCITPSLPYIDLFLVDLKHVADTPLKQWISGSAARMLNSLKKLATTGKKTIIHVPLIQGLNADETSVKATTDFAIDELHVGEIHPLLYHMLGINKYHLLNLPYGAPEKPLDTSELLDFVQQCVCQKGLATTLRG